MYSTFSSVQTITYFLHHKCMLVDKHPCIMICLCDITVMSKLYCCRQAVQITTKKRPSKKTCRTGPLAHSAFLILLSLPNMPNTIYVITSCWHGSHTVQMPCSPLYLPFKKCVIYWKVLFVKAIWNTLAALYLYKRHIWMDT